MSIYGYVRVSSKDQNEDRQMIAQRRLEIPESHIYIDKQSGKDFERPAYRKLLKRLRRDDILYVKSIDRLGRNYEEIQEQWRYITKEIRADIVVLDMPLLDTRQCKDLLGTFISDIVLQLLSFVAENERINIRTRQAEGIAAARIRGVRFGRPEKDVPAKFEEAAEQWLSRRMSLREAAEYCGMPLTTFRTKAMKKAEGNENETA